MDQALNQEINLADENSIAISIERAAHLTYDFVNARLVLGVEGYLAQFGTITRLPVRVEGVIAILLILQQQPEDIAAETVNATIQPEAHEIVHRLAYLGLRQLRSGCLTSYMCK
jgi:hypothetical protein